MPFEKSSWSGRYIKECTWLKVWCECSTCWRRRAARRFGATETSSATEAKANKRSVRAGSVAVNADFHADRWSSVLIEQSTASWDMNGQPDISPGISIPTGVWKRVKKSTDKNTAAAAIPSTVVIPDRLYIDTHLFYTRSIYLRSVITSWYSAYKGH